MTQSSPSNAAASGAERGITERWAHFASELGFERLPGEVVQSAKGLVLDTVGAALAASTLGDCCAEVATLIRANAGKPECTLLGVGERVPALWAAFGNGAFAHALNFDALSRAGGHLGVSAVVAPLAIAERQGRVSGREFITAVAVAAEFTSRLTAALASAGVDANEKFLEGQLLGYVGAAAGAGRLLRFDPRRMHSLMGLALMQSAGTRQVSFEGGAAKAIYGGYTNHGAVLSVMLAEQGIDARCRVLEGPAGIFSLFYGGRHDAALLGEGLGGRFHAADVAFKPWATSNMVHPFIEACLRLRREPGFDAAAIRRVVVRAGPHGAHWFEPAAERRRPGNAATAANSIFFAVAKTLANGGLGLGDFTPGGLAEPAALALAAITDSMVEARIGKGAEVEVELAGGAVLKAVSDGTARVMGYEELAAKFRDCASYAARPVPAAALQQFIERVAALEREADVAALPALLAGGSS